MNQQSKLIDEFLACNGAFSYRKFLRILTQLGYVEVATGKTSGSRTRFMHPESRHLVLFHKPHGAELGAGTVRALRDSLRHAGML